MLQETLSCNIGTRNQKPYCIALSHFSGIVFSVQLLEKGHPMLRKRTTPRKSLSYNARQRLLFLHVLERLELRSKDVFYGDEDSHRRSLERLTSIRRRITAIRS
jgi:hypothetical protein